jgi:glycosyltransferase involved in cell wall biosynthesis
LRILVYPHDLSIGGSQINAIDLAAAATAAGHEAIVYGIPGPLVDYIAMRKLRFIPARPLKYRPAPSRIAQIASIVRSERVDIIHAYEWSTCLDAYYGATALLGTPLVCTVLSMGVPPYIPASVPLIMGTEELGAQARKIQRGDVWVIEPPIDTDRDTPAIDRSVFCQRHQVEDREFLVVTVSRLALDLKLDALVRAIDAVGALAGRHPVRLVLVGDGPARQALEARAEAVNSAHGREVIAFHGADLDPRSAYAAADLVLGMGSSALRAMAIGRPVIVQGERAFSEVFEPSTQAQFLWQGFYGLGNADNGTARLAAQIERLLRDGALREELGRFGREVACDRFSLQRAVGLQLDIYRRVMAGKAGGKAGEALGSAWRALQLEIRNHDPRRKRAGKALEQTILTAAQSGLWPPTDLPLTEQRHGKT